MNGSRTISASNKRIPGLGLKRVWSFRSLILVFTLRDIRIQYAQTRLGIVWSFIQAITAAIIIQFFFGNLIGVKIGNVPYIIYAYPGMMAWYYFSYIVSSSGTSLLQSQQIIKKVYFPKLILPFYKTLVGLFEFLIWFVLYVIMLIYFRVPLSLNSLLLPLGVVFNLITGLSVALWLSAITIRYRDANHIIPYLIGFGIFVTPVFFETAMIPPQFHFLIFLNPMAGVIAFYRWILLGIPMDHLYLLGCIPVVLLLVGGLFYFRKVENKIVDVI